MKVIGLTGGIGSGKSTVSHLLTNLGAVAIDADKVGHEAFQPGTKLWQEIVKNFGEEILKPDKTVDRSRLGNFVFGNQEALSKLNAIMHPSMYEIVKEKIADHRRKGVPVVVLEASLLIEAGWIKLVDEVWVVIASEETVVERIRQSGKWSEEQTRARIRSQLTVEERLKKADRVIDNNGNLNQMKARVKELWHQLDIKQG